MHIKKLHIDKFKCLDDFDINFTGEDGGSSSILIGENGTGKSSMLEAIIRIFMSIYSLQYNSSRSKEKLVIGNYFIEYKYASKNVKIQKENDHYYVWENGNQILKCVRITKFRNFMRNNSNRLLPMRIVSFYSGMNTNIQELNELMYKNYKNAYFDALKCYFGIVEGMPYMPTKHFIYCSDNFTQIYLCAFLCCNNQNHADYLRKQSGIENVSKIRVILNTNKLRDNLNKNIEVEDVDQTLAFLNGELCKLFNNPDKFGSLYSYTITETYNWKADAIDILDFFERLQTIFNAIISVDVIINNKVVNCNGLSEGQRQLIKMIGMLGLCKSQDTLVLLDEPDAHKNPKWKYELKDTIDKILVSSENTQAIIATHDPLVINGVPKDYIRIFERDNCTGSTRVIEPDENTEGMGIDGLLQSEYYGLRTSYDKKATDKFLRRQELYEKLINKDISTEEKAELRALTKEVASMQISRNSIDFLYDDFIKVFRQTEYFEKEYLSFDEMQDRRDKIKEIIKALYEGQV